MTISKYISELLKINKGIEVDTERVSEGSDQYGLFKSPARNVREQIDGSYEITEHYQFLARQKANSKEERKEADEWLEELVYWADDFSVYGEFPNIDGNRRVTGLSITGSPYPMENDDRNILYQMSLSITYEREREDL